jgi:hypothetical protein
VGRVVVVYGKIYGQNGGLNAGNAGAIEAEMINYKQLRSDMLNECKKAAHFQKMKRSPNAH